MVSPTTLPPNKDMPVMPIAPADLPLLYEDEDEGDMGESDPHYVTGDILHNGFKAHLRGQAHYRVFSNLNFYYHPLAPAAYVSPDAMIVTPSRPLGDRVSSYRLGVDGPAPVLVAEVLSERSAQQGDLQDKVLIYATLRVQEYMLVDVTGQYLPQRLLLKRLQADGTWKDMQDQDGGVTSTLGFRVIIDSDGQVRVLDATSGKPYVRPDEADVRVKELEQQLARLQRIQEDGQQP